MSEKELVILERVKLPDEVFNKLKQLHFGYQVAKDVAAATPTDETFRKATEILTEYESFKLQITRKYIPAKFQTSAYIWSADFYEGDLTILKS
jgi:hypothetical protein